MHTEDKLWEDVTFKNVRQSKLTGHFANTVSEILDFGEVERNISTKYVEFLRWMFHNQYF